MLPGFKISALQNSITRQCLHTLAKGRIAGHLLAEDGLCQAEDDSVAGDGGAGNATVQGGNFAKDAAGDHAHRVANRIL